MNDQNSEDRRKNSELSWLVISTIAAAVYATQAQQYYANKTNFIPYYCICCSIAILITSFAIHSWMYSCRTRGKTKNADMLDGVGFGYNVIGFLFLIISILAGFFK